MSIKKKTSRNYTDASTSPNFFLSRKCDAGSVQRVTAHVFSSSHRQVVDVKEMASRTEKDRAKAQQEKFQAILSNFLKDEDNKYCVDCDAKGL